MPSNLFPPKFSFSKTDNSLDSVTGTDSDDREANVLQLLAVEHEPAVEDEGGSGAVGVDWSKN
jgi:hypothetical protein